MLETIEKAWIILSANIEAGVNIECLIEDFDLSWQVKWAEFEEIIQPNIAQLVALLERTLHESGLKHTDIHSVEMMGCGTWIPIIMDNAMKVF